MTALGLVASRTVMDLRTCKSHKSIQIKFIFSTIRLNTRGMWRFEDNSVGHRIPSVNSPEGDTASRHPVHDVPIGQEVPQRELGPVQQSSDASQTIEPGWWSQINFLISLIYFWGAPGVLHDSIWNTAPHPSARISAELMPQCGWKQHKTTRRTCTVLLRLKRRATIS